jgi:hypothetical protein
MRGTTRTAPPYHGGAVAFTALAVLLRRLLDPWPGSLQLNSARDPFGAADRMALPSILASLSPA